MRGTTALLVIVFFVVACEEDYKPNISKSIVGAATGTYAYATTNPQVVVYLTNHGDEPVGFDRWDATIYYYRDKLTDSGWVEWTKIGIYPTSVYDRYTLNPDEIYADTILVRKPGTYRFRFPILLNNDPVRLNMVTSNVFMIE